MQLWKYTFYLLILILFGLGIAIFQLPDSNLHVIVCDVGQGDAILIIYKNTQILTDGGPDNKVIGCLGRYMPFWDREIELMVSTHPDADHSSGLVEVTKRYKVDSILINPIDSGTQTIKALESAVGGRGVKVVRPLEGNRYGLGLIHLDIFNPDQNLIDALTEKTEGDPLGFFIPKVPTNTYGIVYRLGFGKFNGLFMADVGPDVSDRIASENQIGPLDYIKVSHHGSKNGITENLLKELMPKITVISVGKKNPYHHPNQELLDMLNKYNVKTVRTDESGDVEVITDGEKYWLKN